MAEHTVRTPLLQRGEFTTNSGWVGNSVSADGAIYSSNTKDYVPPITYCAADLTV